MSTHKLKVMGIKIRNYFDSLYLNLDCCYWLDMMKKSHYCWELWEKSVCFNHALWKMVCINYWHPEKRCHSHTHCIHCNSPQFHIKLSPIRNYHSTCKTLLYTQNKLLSNKSHISPHKHTHNCCLSNLKNIDRSLLWMDKRRNCWLDSLSKHLLSSNKNPRYNLYMLLNQNS